MGQGKRLHGRANRMVKLFVYGTLRKGEALNPYLILFKYLGKATLNNFKMYSNDYFPMIIKGEGKVIGEVYEINTDNESHARVLSFINTIEGQYDKTKVEVKLNGELIDAVTYVYSFPIYDYHYQIKGGDWKNQR